MGFFDIFRLNNAATEAAKAAAHQRSIARKLAALPMPEFVPECLRRLNRPDNGWTAHVRPPHRGARVLAANKHLPDELADFYCMSDGFESPDEHFPARVLAISSLRLGAACKPPVTELLTAYWAQHNNPSDKPDLLLVRPVESRSSSRATPPAYLSPSALDLAFALCPPRPADMVLLLVTDATSELPRGTVLHVKNGAATQYKGFKAWLGSCAALAGSSGAVAKKYL